MSNISIIVSSFESDASLRTSLRSISEQSYTDFEVLVLVPASCSSAVAIVAEMNDRRFNFLVHGTLSPTTAQNFAASQANGCYLVFIDSPVYWPNSELANAMLNIDKAAAHRFGVESAGCTVVFDSTGAKSGYLKSEDYKRAGAEQSLLQKAPRFLPKASRRDQSDSHSHRLM